MKLILLLLLPLFACAQEGVTNFQRANNINTTISCVYVDTVFVTAKVRELGTRDIRFGIKQITEDALSEKYCLDDKGDAIKVEIYYFGIPKNTIRVMGIERSNVITQVGVRLYHNNSKYEGIGESETEITAVLIEVKEGTIPFEKMTVSSALKKAINEAISKMP
jgi:hypothetical protein